MEIVQIVGLKRKDGLNSVMICVTTRRIKTREATVCMTVSKSAVHWKVRALPEIRFAD